MTRQRRRPAGPDTDMVAVGAIGLAAVYLFLAFGWRTWLQWRRTGESGFRLSRNDPAPARIATLLMVSGATVGFFGTLRARRAPARRAFLPRPARWAGLGIMAAATATTLRAQLDMGRSWRVGVDENERTDLVTDGLFALSRNPIFACMGAFAIGTMLAVPDVLTTAGATALVTGLELQVRRVEEPYLLRVHGGRYADYAARVGRFAPEVGRLPRTPAE